MNKAFIRDNRNSSGIGIMIIQKNNANENNNINMITLPLAMQNSLSSEASEVLMNIAEVGLDAVMSEGFLKEVPFLSTAVSMFNIGNSIKERHCLIKLASFVYALNNGMADNNKRDYYRKKITDDPKKRKIELEYVLILIDRYLDANKPSMLAKLYLAYLDERITWDDFTKYAEVIDRFLPGDCETLLSAVEFKTERDINTDSIQRLIALGLVIEGFRTMAIQKDNGTLHIDPPELRERNERNYKRTEFGNILADIISVDV